MRTKRQFLALAGAVGALYALGALSTFWYFDDPAAGAAFFPAAGLTVAALLLTPRRAWPWILSAVALAEISVDLSHGQSVTMAFGFAAANVAEPLAGALLLRTAVRKLEPRTRGYLVEYVMCAVVIAPIVGAAIG